MRQLLTVLGFLVSIVLAGMIFIMVCSINLVLNGYDKDCGSTPGERAWRNSIPFACDR